MHLHMHALALNMPRSNPTFALCNSALQLSFMTMRNDWCQQGKVSYGHRAIQQTMPAMWLDLELYIRRAHGFSDPLKRSLREPRLISKPGFY